MRAQWSIYFSRSSKQFHRSDWISYGFVPQAASWRGMEGRSQNFPRNPHLKWHPLQNSWPWELAKFLMEDLQGEFKQLREFRPETIHRSSRYCLIPTSQSEKCERLSGGKQNKPKEGFIKIGWSHWSGEGGRRRVERAKNTRVFTLPIG